MYAIHYHVRSEGQIVKKTVYIAMLDMPTDCCYFVDKAAAVHAASAFNNYFALFCTKTVFTQTLGQTKY